MNIEDLKHTKGEWVARTDNVFTKIFPYNKEMKMPIMVVNHYENSISEMLANAKLIASAPELLETLMTVHSQLIDGGYFKEDSALMLSIKNVIEKST